MSNRAFIYSLPRSRSAWLSVFLTGRDSFCFHEPTAAGDVVWLFESRPEASVCGVDTGAFIVQPDAGKALGAKCYALRRDPDAIQKSCDELFPEPFDVDSWLDEFERVTDGMPVIESERLSDPEYQREVFEDVTGQEYDPVRGKALAEMNIQRDLGMFMASL